MLVILQSIAEAASHTQTDTGSETAANIRMLVFQSALHELIEFRKSIIAKVDVYENRISRIRPELEAYIDGH